MLSRCYRQAGDEMIHNRGKRHRTDMFPVRVGILRQGNEIAAQKDANDALNAEQALRQRAGAGLFDSGKVIRPGAACDRLARQEFQSIRIGSGFSLYKHGAAPAFHSA